MLCQNPYKTSIICIDSYENCIMTGRISNPFLEEDIPFHSTMQFLKEMCSLLQDLEHPQSFSENREFCPIEKPSTRAAALAPCTAPRNGLLATFSLRILFCQHASWQGSLLWSAGKQEKNFRSVLELLHLIDNVLEDIVA